MFKTTQRIILYMLDDIFSLVRIILFSFFDLKKQKNKKEIVVSNGKIAMPPPPPLPPPSRRTNVYRAEMK